MITVIRLLGAGEIGVGVMSMLALAVMTVGLLRSWKVRGVACLMHCCAVLIFEALSVIGSAAAVLTTMPTNGPDRGLFSSFRSDPETRAVGGAITAVVLLELIWTLFRDRRGTKQRIPQVCLCVLLAIGVLVIQSHWISWRLKYLRNKDDDPDTLHYQLPMYTVPYMHIINAAAVIVTVLNASTTCGGTTEMCLSCVTQGVQQLETSGRQRASWRVGDVVLTGALMASTAGVLLKSTVVEYPRYTDDMDYMTVSIISTCTDFFIALLAVFLAGVHLSQEGGVAALLGRGAVWVTLALACAAVVVWAVGMATLADSPPHSPPGGIKSNLLPSRGAPCDYPPPRGN